MYDLY